MYMITYLRLSFLQKTNILTHSKYLGLVLSVDRTFNLGAHFLTAITFKNNTVTFRNNNSNPVFLSPYFLHKNAKQEVYNHFSALLIKSTQLFP